MTPYLKRKRAIEILKRRISEYVAPDFTTNEPLTIPQIISLIEYQKQTFQLIAYYNALKYHGADPDAILLEILTTDKYSI
jgi:hypothetical protein